MITLRTALTLWSILRLAASATEGYAPDLARRVTPANLPFAQVPAKAPPDLAMPESPRTRAFFRTLRALQVEVDKRLDPNGLYVQRGADRLRSFHRDVVNRAIFETIHPAHGDRQLLLDAVYEMVGQDRRLRDVNLGLVYQDMDWIFSEKRLWLQTVIGQIRGAELAQGPPVRIQVLLPTPLWISAPGQRIQAPVLLASNDLPRLEEELGYIQNRPKNFDLSVPHVTDSLRRSLQQPAEAELRERFGRGRVLADTFFYARLWQAVFLNIARFQGDPALLSEALDRLAPQYPEIPKVKDAILRELPRIKAERLDWMIRVVLPRLEQVDRQPRPNVPMPAAQMPVGIDIDLPRIAWILAEPGPENIPKESFTSYAIAKAETDLLRVLP